jgi:hypothetical protein
MSTVDEIAQVETGLPAVRDAAATAYEAWFVAQRALIEPFLKDQARRTVIQQAEVTEALGEKLGELKADVRSSIEECLQLFDRAFAGRGDAMRAEHGKHPWDGDTQWWSSKQTRIAEPLGAVFMAAGYDHGSPRTSHPGLRYGWGFYSDQQTARVAWLPVASSELAAVNSAWGELRDHTRRLEALREKLRKENAAEAWDDL